MGDVGKNTGINPKGFDNQATSIMPLQVDQQDSRFANTNIT